MSAVPVPLDADRKALATHRAETWYTLPVTLSIEIPEATLRALGPSPFEAEGRVRLAAAMKLHELGHLSAGAAADLAAMPKVEFLHKLADFGVEAFRVRRIGIRPRPRYAAPVAWLTTSSTPLRFATCTTLSCGHVHRSSTAEHAVSLPDSRTTSSRRTKKRLMI